MTYSHYCACTSHDQVERSPDINAVYTLITGSKTGAYTAFVCAYDSVMAKACSNTTVVLNPAKDLNSDKAKELVGSLGSQMDRAGNSGDNNAALQVCVYVWVGGCVSE